MCIPLDANCSTPLHQQIAEHLRRQILAGALMAETRLPATRSWAQELGVSRITVVTAYATLESEGLIYNRAGSGAYVLGRPLSAADRRDEPHGGWPPWQQAAAQTDAPNTEAQRSPRSHSVATPQPLSFTGVGNPREYPIKELLHTLQDVLQRDGASALEYGALDSGYPPLRATIAHVLGSQGISVHPDTVLITAGSQQALALVCGLLLKPGDTLLVESPTYNLALELFRTLDLRVIGVPVDADGMVVEQMEPLLAQHRPKLIYTIPNFQNPTGVCLSGARRRQLVMLAQHYAIPLLEDDFVGDLRYEGRVLPALITLAQRGGVIYAGTFSKMLMPGLRVGFLVADGPVFQRLTALKRVNDLTVSPLMQRTLNAYVNVGQYQTHLRRSCRLYRQRRDMLVAAVQRYLPPDVQLVPPQGGLFAWVRLPPGVSCLDLLPLAAEEGVEYAPGTRFCPEVAEGEGFLRLNFAVLTPEEIDEGVRRLGRALERYPSLP